MSNLSAVPTTAALDASMCRYKSQFCIQPGDWQHQEPVFFNLIFITRLVVMKRYTLDFSVGSQSKSATAIVTSTGYPQQKNWFINAKHTEAYNHSFFWCLQKPPQMSFSTLHERSKVTLEEDAKLETEYWMHISGKLSLGYTDFIHKSSYKAAYVPRNVITFNHDFSFGYHWEAVETILAYPWKVLLEGLLTS